jgi:hypothetical protein
MFQLRDRQGRMRMRMEGVPGLDVLPPGGGGGQARPLDLARGPASLEWAFDGKNLSIRLPDAVADSEEGQKAIKAGGGKGRVLRQEAPPEMVEELKKQRGTAGMSTGNPFEMGMPPGLSKKSKQGLKVLEKVGDKVKMEWRIPDSDDINLKKLKELAPVANLEVDYEHGCFERLVMMDAQGQVVQELVMENAEVNGVWYPRRMKIRQDVAGETVETEAVFDGLKINESLSDSAFALEEGR